MFDNGVSTGVVLDSDMEYKSCRNRPWNKPAKVRQQARPELELVEVIASTWTKPVVTVAFADGEYEVLKLIKMVANEWTENTGIKFDFGEDEVNKTFRRWHPTDAVSSADIRVGFFTEGVNQGFWSAIGSDCLDSETYPLSGPTLNLHYELDNLPEGWETLVRHEFGHALGLGHEHQSPAGGCENEFRWEDDEGYIKETDEYGHYIANDATGLKPGLFTIMSGEPDNWADEEGYSLEQRVIDNYASYTSDLANPRTGFDDKSVMLYYHEAWMLKDGVNSTCYISDENTELSELDKLGIRLIYPIDGSFSNNDGNS